MFRVRVRLFALKGHSITAQGNALGVDSADAMQALKGRDKIIPPFQGLRAPG